MCSTRRLPTLYYTVLSAASPSTRSVPTSTVQTGAPLPASCLVRRLKSKACSADVAAAAMDCEPPELIVALCDGAAADGSAADESHSDDLYEVLGVARDANLEEIRSAYRSRALRYAAAQRSRGLVVSA